MAVRESGHGVTLDFVVVTTPNVSHFEICRAFLERGIAVVCDKPLTVSATQAEELARIAADKNLVCCVTCTFAGNPFVRLMKALFRGGASGKPYYLDLSFLHGRRLSQVMRDARSAWRFLPEISGPAGSIGDLGAHLEYLARFISGRDVEKVLARLIFEPGGIALDSSATVMFEMSGGLQGSMQIAQLACGHDTDIKIEAWGDAGTLSWNFSSPNELKADYPNGRTEIFRDPGLSCPEVRRFDRIQAPNADRATACFINLYDEYMEALAAHKKTLASDAVFPTFGDGVKGVRFIEACVKSHRQGSVWVEV
jgi:predicted dehydrogenase